MTKCIFGELEIRTEVHPRLAREYTERWGPYPKRFFGGLQKLWDQRHCKEINPYDATYCPYEKRDCWLAYYRDASASIAEARTAKGVLGLFRIKAFRSGIWRADNKPLARELYSRTNGQQDSGRLRVGPRTGPVDDMAGGPGPGPGLPGVPAVETDQGGGGLYRPSRGLVSIGDLLRSSDVRSHPRDTRGREGPQGEDDEDDD